MASASARGTPGRLARMTWPVKATELVDVLARVPTGRLVVLGEPGSGKTMLMVRLVLDLLARRTGGDPVPFLVSVASWNPTEQDLRDWLGTQLLIDHPALAGPPPEGMTEPTQAAALLASGLILPILDGLDEIPEQVRGPAISRINDALRPGEQVVVTCRTQQYRDARPARGWSRGDPPRGGGCSVAPAGRRCRPQVTSVMTRQARSRGPAGTLSWRCSVLRRRPGRHCARR